VREALDLLAMAAHTVLPRRVKLALVVRRVGRCPHIDTPACCYHSGTAGPCWQSHVPTTKET
jgi:hypothetical protein